MRCPSLKEEKKLWRRGYQVVAGLDEAGRGPLAGPVVATAVSIGNWKLVIGNLKGVRDSKKLSSSQREKLYKTITRCSEIRWGIGIVSEKVIDKINILEATKLAMEKAVKNLVKKIRRKSSERNLHDRGNFAPTNFLILDGNFKLDLDIPQKSVVKGDQKVFSCAVASILAKVIRDRLMKRYHQKYPQYRFDVHKGYGTQLHFKLLKKYGPCPIHRRTFSLLKGDCPAKIKNTLFKI
jgi:ribonuclease HII